jgi:RNA polymerase sigma factor (sigma-70 family)
MTDAQQLMAEYARNGSERAFRELVARYVDLVYSTAVRQVRGDVHLAEDVVQTVFVDLARMAGRLSGEVMLGGWLHRHTCFVAAHALRGELRRQAREHKAVEMNSLNENSEAGFPELSALLDRAINELGQRDRLAILLRFYEQRDFRSMGEALGIGEDAARMRVNRALEKLQARLKQLGIGSSATALGNSLTTQALIAVPAGLAAGISIRALAVIGSLGTGSGAAVPWVRWAASSPAKIVAVLVVSASLGYVASRSFIKGVQPPLLRPTENAGAAFAAVSAPAPQPAQPARPDFAAPPPSPLPMAVVTAGASAARPNRPPADALEIYADLTGRTVLHGHLPPLPGSLAAQMLMNTNDAVELLAQQLTNTGYGLVLDGEKFALIIPTADMDKPRFRPPPLNPESALHADAATNSISFPAIDLNTFLDIYQKLSSRTILCSPKLGNPILGLQSQTGLTSEETAYAMGIVLYLNGIAAVGDGDKFVQMVPVSEASLVRTNAPATEPGAGMINSRSVPGFESTSPTVDDLEAFYGKLAGKTIRISSRLRSRPVIFRVETPLTNAELRYAIETVFTLNGLQIGLAGDRAIHVQTLSGQGRQDTNSPPASN